MNFFDFALWQDFVSNLSATLIGVILGIPGAFLINRWIESYSEKEKKAKILISLRSELTDNHLKVSDWYRGGEQDSEMITLGASLSDEIWNAFSAGGELQWIKDTLLLADLATVYEEIRYIKYLADKYLTVGLRDEDVTDLRSIISNDLWFAIDGVTETILNVQERIEKHYVPKALRKKNWIEQTIMAQRAKRKGKAKSRPART